MQELSSDKVSAWLLENDVTETVWINKAGQPHAVMIPYDIFQAMHKNSRVAVRTEDLTDRGIEAIRNSRVPAATGKYNDELDD